MHTDNALLHNTKAMIGSERAVCKLLCNIWEWFMILFMHEAQDEVRLEDCLLQAMIRITDLSTAGNVLQAVQLV